MVGRPTSPTLAAALLSGHLHRPRTVARTDPLQPKAALRPVAPTQCRGLARRRCSAQKSGRPTRLAGGAADLDAGSALSSPRPLRRARRWSVLRWLALAAS